jgi:hypothetical protein
LVVEEALEGKNVNKDLFFSILSNYPVGADTWVKQEWRDYLYRIIKP